MCNTGRALKCRHTILANMWPLLKFLQKKYVIAVFFYTTWLCDTARYFPVKLNKTYLFVLTFWKSVIILPFFWCLSVMCNCCHAQRVFCALRRKHCRSLETMLWLVKLPYTTWIPSTLPKQDNNQLYHRCDSVGKGGGGEFVTVMLQRQL